MRSYYTLGDGPKYLRRGSLVKDIRDPSGATLRVVLRRPQLPWHKRLSYLDLRTGRTRAAGPGPRVFILEDSDGCQHERHGMYLTRVG